MIFFRRLFKQQGRVSPSEWPHCCSRAVILVWTGCSFQGWFCQAGKSSWMPAVTGDPQSTVVFWWRLQPNCHGGVWGRKVTIFERFRTIPLCWFCWNLHYATGQGFGQMTSYFFSFFYIPKTERGRRSTLLLGWFLHSFSSIYFTVYLFWLLIVVGKKMRFLSDPCCIREICSSSRMLSSKIIFDITIRWFLYWCSCT